MMLLGERTQASLEIAVNGAHRSHGDPAAKHLSEFRSSNAQ
jgi:hypothetical protein